MSLLDEALAISADLGMRPLPERIIALQERAKSQPAAIAAYPGGLTQREVEAAIDRRCSPLGLEPSLSAA